MVENGPGAVDKPDENHFIVDEYQKVIATNGADLS